MFKMEELLYKLIETKKHELHSISIVINEILRVIECNKDLILSQDFIFELLDVELQLISANYINDASTCLLLMISGLE